jgi:hypothetical protein
MRHCIFASIILLALLAGCNSTKPVQPKPIGIVRRIEPQTPDTPNYVAPQGMSRAEVYDMLEERARATNEAVEAKERQSRQKQTRRSTDRLNIYLGAPYWHYGYHRPYYYGHCWPWHGHHGAYRRHW